jgi:hypothetical protein
MLYVSMASTSPVISGTDREELDQRAKDLICDGYRAASSSIENPHGKFNAALKAYQKAYPHVAREVARHAVAIILCTSGM